MSDVDKEKVLAHEMGHALKLNHLVVDVFENAEIPNGRGYYEKESVCSIMNQGEPSYQDGYACATPKWHDIINLKNKWGGQKMKKMIFMILVSLLLLSSCGKNESIPFSTLMSAEMKTTAMEDRIGYKDFEDYLSDLQNFVETQGGAVVLVRLQPLERTQYMELETKSNGDRFLTGYTTTWVKILEVYEQVGEAELEAGDKISFRQNYYLQPRTEEGLEEMIRSFGGKIEVDADGNRRASIEDGTYEFFPVEETEYALMLNPNTIPLDENREYYAYIWLLDGKASLSKVVAVETHDLHVIEEYRNLPLDPDIQMVMKGLFERAETARKKGTETE